MIHVSKAAIAEIRRLQSRQSHLDLAAPLFRLAVQPGGCAGLVYVIGFDQTLTAADQIYDLQDVRIVVDLQSLSYLKGLTLDYSEDLMGGGFRFHNPNITQSCGCGNSFSVTS